MSTMQFLMSMPMRPSAPTMAQNVVAWLVMSKAKTMPMANMGMQQKMMTEQVIITVVV